jgi:predicted  nucleic acid-binding Zn-ribbon protein
MNEQTSTIQAAEPRTATPKPAQRAISDPREVAAVVMGRMNQVKSRKEELNIAIDGLVEITQQLTRAYGAQLVAVEQLRRRVKALEAQLSKQAASRLESVQ